MMNIEKDHVLEKGEKLLFKIPLFLKLEESLHYPAMLTLTTKRVLIRAEQEDMLKRRDKSIVQEISVGYEDIKNLKAVKPVSSFGSINFSYFNAEGKQIVASIFGDATILHKVGFHFRIRNEEVQAAMEFIVKMVQDKEYRQQIESDGVSMIGKYNTPYIPLTESREHPSFSRIRNILAIVLLVMLLAGMVYGVIRVLPSLYNSLPI